MDQSSLEMSKLNKKLTFEAETMNICPLDYCRLIYSFSADHKR